MSLKEAIKTAAKGLDNARDEDWQEDGRPSLKRIQQLAKTSAITQDQLDDALPDLRREKSKSSVAVKATPEANKTNNAAKAAKAPAKLAPKKAPQSATDTDAIRAASGVDQPAEVASKNRSFVENVLVTATEQGYFGSKIREPGESFYYTGRLGSWMEIADPEEREAYAQERAASADGDDSEANVDPVSASL